VQTNHLPFRRKATTISTTTSQESQKHDRESSAPVADMPVDENNIFNFGHYFKKRYLE